MTTPAQELTVLFVSHTAEPGGAELALLKYLKNHSHIRKHCLFLADGEILAEAHDSEVSSILSESGRAMKAPKDVFEVYKQLSPDLVVSNSMRAAVFVSLSRIPRAKHVYYIRDAIDRAHLSLYKYLIVRIILTIRIGAVITNSQYLKNQIDTIFRGEVEVALSACGVSERYIRNAEASRHHDLLMSGRSATQPIRILNLSRLAEWKGQAVLLTALEILAEQIGYERIEVTFAGGPLFGEETYAADLKRRIEKSRVRVRMTGHVQDVKSLLSNHDILAHTSLIPEPFGQVVVQGIASGLLVVAPSEGGPLEILGTAGRYWDAPAPHSLAQALRHAIDQYPHRIWNEIAAGCDRARDFTDERAFASLDFALYKLRTDGRVKRGRFGRRRPKRSEVADHRYFSVATFRPLCGARTVRLSRRVSGIMGGILEKGCG